MKQIPNVKLERVSRSVNGKENTLAILVIGLANPDQLMKQIPNVKLERVSF